MERKTRFVVALLAAGFIGAGIVYANSDEAGDSAAYFAGHTHDADGTHGAPSHSGGLDRQGCHNKSVPYHCH